MSKTTKTMWLRRVSQLGLAGALLMPLSLSGSEAAVQAEKNSEDVYNIQAASLKKLFDEIEAKRRDAMLKASDGNYAEALKELGDLQKQSSKFNGNFAKSKASEIANNIRRIKRVYSSEIMEKARGLVAEKKYEEAISCYDKALALKLDAYNEGRLLWNKAKTLEITGKKAEALEIYKKCAEYKDNVFFKRDSQNAVKRLSK